MLRWLPVFVSYGFIFYLSSQTGTTLDSAGLGKEYLHVSGHFMMFFVLGCSLYFATKNILLSILIGLALGCSDEFHQRYTPGRSVELKDVIVDTIGISIGTILLWSSRFIQKKS